MKKKNLKATMLALGIAILATGSLVMSFMPADGIMYKEGKATVINTTLLGKDVRGFKGQTPLKVYIENDKVVKIEALKNQETPKFFARAKALLAQYEGKNTSKAAKLKVDSVSGATYSSKALKQNVELALKYYKKHKK